MRVQPLFLSLIMTLCASISVGCSSGGGSDSNSSPPPNSSSSSSSSSSSGEMTGAQPELATAAIETSKNTISSSMLDIPTAAIVTADTELETRLRNDMKILATTAADLANSPVAATTTESGSFAGDCGGSASYTVTTTMPDEQDTYYPMLLEADMTYNDLCMAEGGYETNLNGTAYMEMSVTELEEVSEFRFDLTYTSTDPAVGSGTLKGTERCVWSDSLEDETCTESMDYEGADGSDYQLTNTEVRGDNSTGYEIAGTLTSSEDGTYQLDGYGLTLCDNGNFGSGTIEVLQNEADYLSITFNNCTEMVVTFDGQTEVMDQ